MAKSDLLFITILILEIVGGGTFAGLYELYGQVYWLVITIIWVLISLVSVVLISIKLTKENENEKRS